MPSRAAVLAVKITGDGSGAAKAFRETDDHVKGLSGNLDALTGPATVAMAAITAGAGFAAKAASDLEETTSKVGTVFGATAGEIEAWASTAAKSMGMSKQAAMDAAGSFGTMFTALGFTTTEAAGMSTNMTQLAADLASFHNVSGGAAQVTDMMSAAFRGEYDSIQALIPTINAAAVEQKALEDTGKTSAKALTEQEKAAATLALVMEGAGPAVGDFARTSDGAANSSRTAQAALSDAAAALGTALLPAVTAAAGALTGLAAWLTENQTAALVLAGVVGGLAAAIVIASTATKVFQTVTLAMKAAMGIVKAAQIAWTIATNAYTISAIAAGVASMFAYWPILLIVAAIAAVIAIIVVVVKKWDVLVDAMKTAANWIKSVFVGAWDAVVGAIQNVIEWFERLWEKVRSIGDSIGGVMDKINPFTSMVGGNAVLIGAPSVSARAGTATTVNINVEGVADPYALARLLTRQMADYAHVQGRSAGAPLAEAW